jgi:hypothetical protein
MQASLLTVMPSPAFSIIRGRSLIWRFVLSNLFTGVVLILAFGMDASGSRGMEFCGVCPLSRSFSPPERSLCTLGNLFSQPPLEVNIARDALWRCQSEKADGTP